MIEHIYLLWELSKRWTRLKKGKGSLSYAFELWDYWTLEICGTPSHIYIWPLKQHRLRLSKLESSLSVVQECPSQHALPLRQLGAGRGRVVGRRGRARDGGRGRQAVPHRDGRVVRVVLLQVLVDGRQHVDRLLDFFCFSVRLTGELIIFLLSRHSVLGGKTCIATREKKW